MTKTWMAAFLPHDAHEYAMGDIATPVAEALAARARQDVSDTCEILGFTTYHSAQNGAAIVVRNSIKRLKSAPDAAIYAAAGIPWSLDQQAAAVVNLYDARMLETERGRADGGAAAPLEKARGAF